MLFWLSIYHHPTQLLKKSQFARRSSRAQPPWDEPFALEEFLLTVPDPAKTREWSIYYTSGPHYLSLGLSQGLWTQNKWQEFGVDASIKEYTVDNPGYPFTVPKHSRLALLDRDAGGHVLYEASLVENSTDVNLLSGEAVIVPPFLSFSPSCNLNASVVYANFGTKEDFEDLSRININVTGRLVLIKAGKAQGALLEDIFLKTGLAGYITYPDPQQDGEFTEDNGYMPYPDGPARAPASVFRQSGPQTHPNESSPDPIPILPISYADAIPILRALNGHGPRADELGDSWKGGRLGYRGVEYNVGPTPSNIVLNMHIEMEESQVIAYDVVGTIKGEIEDVVVIGNHRDAWGAGAADPNSGSAILNELVRGFGLAVQLGWRPLRTLVFIIAYVEAPNAVSGRHYFTKASPLLGSLFREVTAQIPSPNQPIPGQSVLDLWGGSLGPQGGGDAAMFVRQCITTGDFGFEQGQHDPVFHWHSSFDTVAWMDRFGDPGFHYHMAAARVWALLTARFVDSPVLPFNVTEYAVTLRQYIDLIEEQADETFGSELSFEALYDALSRLHSVAVKFDTLAAELRESGSTAFDHEVKIVNGKYRMFERQFYREEGNGVVQSNKNIIFQDSSYKLNKPGFAGLANSVESGDLDGAEEWLGIIQSKIEDAIDLLEG
ncbi:hypothetical protein SI65_04506 [Aspergillus cristatus]|uniref:Transferrin receptor-like dimerisation domain-containing protein n=1 Tax=Aspergillus cristatus TaxID=573508 RepID=A0A1E3BEY3_ASPCR|nr:hypothetical protein SI65_04506 [Aspergillus cristatus]